MSVIDLAITGRQSPSVEIDEKRWLQSLPELHHRTALSQGVPMIDLAALTWNHALYRLRPSHFHLLPTQTFFLASHHQLMLQST